MQRLFCYVDETGQDTRGAVFIVAAIIVGEEALDQWRSACEDIERLSRKGKRKWMRTTPDRRLAYMRLVLQKHLFVERLTFARHTDTRDYDRLTAQTIALAVRRAGGEGNNVVLIDALPKELWKDYARWIRRSGAKVEKVRGVRREEEDAIMRLADAVCGFVRIAYTGQSELKDMFESAVKQGRIVDLRTLNEKPP